MSLAASEQEPLALSMEAIAELKRFRQADVVAINAVLIMNGDVRQAISLRVREVAKERSWWKFWRRTDRSVGEAEMPLAGARVCKCPEGLAVVISQSCDLTNSDRLTAQIAPLVRLRDSAKSEAQSGRRPRYVAVPMLGDDAFADLESIATIDKEHLAKLDRRPGVRETHEALDFARGVGRRFSRFAFPDVVVPALGQLQKIVKNKYGRQGSLGRALANVAMLRVEEAADWVDSTFHISLHVIYEEDVLPIFPDEGIPEEPDTVAQLVYDVNGRFKATPQQVADAIWRAKDAASLHWLWHHFATAMATACMPSDKLSKETIDSVLEVDAQVFAVDEYVMSLYRRSVELDLDYLSDPQPV